MRDACDMRQIKNCLPDCKTEMQKFTSLSGMLTSMPDIG